MGEFVPVEELKRVIPKLEPYLSAFKNTDLIETHSMDKHNVLWIGFQLYDNDFNYYHNYRLNTKDLIVNTEN